VALWEYDKREANGQFNVYFGMFIRPSTGPIADQLIAYAKTITPARCVFVYYYIG